MGEALKEPEETMQKMKHGKLLKYWVPTNRSSGPWLDLDQISTEPQLVTFGILGTVL